MAARHNPPLIAARAFEAAARHLSFQKAAQELNVTPTAVSHQVKRLEEYLGAPLFVRMNRAVALTCAGMELAEQLKELFGKLEDVLDPERARTEGIITITVMPSLAAKWLSPRLPDFEKRYPQWRVRMDVDGNLVDLLAGLADVGLRYGPGKYPGLHARHWMDAPVSPVCSPALLEKVPLKKLADLRNHTLIHDDVSERPGGPPHWSEFLKKHRVSGVDLTRGPRFTGTYMSLEAAEAGHGIALASAPLIERDVDKGRLVKPFNMAMENPYAYWIVCTKKRVKEEKIKAMTHWLVEQARRD